jgi:hypothetical protein
MSSYREPAMNTRSAAYELRYYSLLQQDRMLAFPCDKEGHVDIDGLDSRERLDYFYARTVIGREFRRPVVTPAALH